MRLTILATFIFQLTTGSFFPNSNRWGKRDDEADRHRVSGTCKFFQNSNPLSNRKDPHKLWAYNMGHK